MKQLIDKSTLVAEIKKRLSLLENGTSDSEVMKRVDGVIKGYKSILSFLDTLNVKEEILDKEGKTKLMKKCVHKAYKRGYDMGVLKTTNEMNHNMKDVDLEEAVDDAKDLAMRDMAWNVHVMISEGKSIGEIDHYVCGICDF